MKKEKLLQIRRHLKKKKPKFIRQDAHKKAKLYNVWRRPKGIDSKMRLGLRGYRRPVEIGWGSPKEVKHLHKSGLEQVMVHNPEELGKVDAKKQGVVIAGAVGTRNRVAIVREAMQKNITILNIKNPQEYLQGVEAKMRAKAEEKKKMEKAKPEKKVEKKVQEPVLDDEERKKKEKEEKDKILTKPER
jgi:large subunit ribosomal protein L32e